MADNKQEENKPIEFRLDLNAAKQLARQKLPYKAFLLAQLSLVFAILIFAEFVQDRDKSIFFILTICIALIVAPIVLSIDFRRTVRVYTDSYYRLLNQKLIHYPNKGKPYVIHLTDLKRVDNKRNGFHIRSFNRRHFIPNKTDNFEELLESVCQVIQEQ